MHCKKRKQTADRRGQLQAIYFLLNGFVLASVSFTLNVDRIGLSNGDELAGVELKEDNEEFVRFLWGIGGGARPGSAVLLGGGGGGGGFFPSEGCLARVDGSLCEWMSV